MLGRLLEKRTFTGGLAPWMTGQTVPAPWEDIRGSGYGGTMNETAALRVAAVWACVSLVADALAAAPVDQYRKSATIRTPLPLSSSISDPGAGEITPHDWWFALVSGLMLCGNAYAVKADLDPLGYPRSLPLWDPTKVHPNLDNGRIVSYSYRGEVVPAERILHLRAFTFPGRPLGLGPLELFGQTIGMAAAAEAFGFKFFSEGAIPSAILYSDSELTEEQAKGLKERIMQAWRWKREPAVLGAGLKYEKVSLDPKEAAFLESQQFTIQEICRIFRVPPEMVGHSSSGQNITYANVEERQIGLQQWTLLPWAARIETALTTVVPRGQFVKLNLDALIRTDLLSRYKAHGLALRDGWDTADHRRELEDLEPLPNGQGDVALWPILPKLADTGPESVGGAV